MTVRPEGIQQLAGIGGDTSVAGAGPLAWNSMPSVLHSHTRPIWAEISASRLRANLAALQSAAGPQVEMLAVVKANAYGHGATECAPVLAAAGARWLGVTSAEEGVAVRGALGTLPQPGPRVLVMCGIWPGEQAECIDRCLTPVVWEPYHLDLLEAEARRRGMPPGSLAVHAEIDTGMARQGVTAGTLLHRLLLRFTHDSPLALEGVMTHLASTERADDPQNRQQMDAFAGALQQVSRAGLRPSLVHAGNTSSADSGLAQRDLPALAERYGAQAMTRAGLALYGYALPLLGEESHLQPALQPVMTWKTRVISLREVQAGDTIGYNAAYIASGTMRLALLPVGYADGYRRGLSSSTGTRGGHVLLHGRRAPVIGRVSMDLTIVDVTAIPEAAIGDEAVLLGSDAAEHFGADAHARIADTSVYEVLCGISDRVPRVVV